MSRKIETNHIVNLLLSILLATVAFNLLFTFMQAVSYIGYKDSTSKTNAILQAITELENVSKNATCNEAFISNVSRKLDEVATRISILEERWGKNNPQVIEQKKLYSELEYRHFNIIKNSNEKCETDFVPFFFFYSNEPESSEYTEDISFILQYFKKENSNKVMIYSFDYNLDYDLIKSLKQEYSVTNAPVVIYVKNKESFTPSNIGDIRKYLD